MRRSTHETVVAPSPEELRKKALRSAPPPDFDDETTVPNKRVHEVMAELLRARDARIERLEAEVERLTGAVHGLTLEVTELSTQRAMQGGWAASVAPPAPAATRLPEPQRAGRSVTGYVATAALAMVGGCLVAGAWFFFSPPAPHAGAPAARDDASAQGSERQAEPALTTREAATAAHHALAPPEQEPIEPNPRPRAEDVASQELLSFEGALTITSPLDAEVFVHGVPSGRTNQRIVTRCGWKNVRLRGGDRVWLTPGQVVKLPCAQEVSVAITP